jgi:hypothetical protein
MSYTLQFINGSPYPVTVSDGTTLSPGDSWATGSPIGNAWFRSNELGPINFLDIASKHIPGDSKETWGVLISYQGEELVARYEGGGNLGVTLNELGQAELTGMDIRQVELPGFIFDMS